jgi:hypothetical protein
MSFVGIFTCRYTNMGITMSKWTLEGCTKVMVLGRLHLAKSGRTIARSGRNIARLGHTTSGRSWPDPAAARPEPAAYGQSRPWLAKAGHTWPWLGPTAPLGVPAPILCNVLGPRHKQSQEQVLDGWETSILCRLDQKSKVGSTWIDRPTLHYHNRHQGVILDITPHRRCITWWFGRCSRTYMVDRTYQLVCQAKLTQGADLQPPQEQWSGSFKSIGSGS